MFRRLVAFVPTVAVGASLTVFQTVFAAPEVEEGTWDSNWDHLEGNKKYGSSPHRARYLILVRHGQYEYTDSDETRVLTKLGREQADLTGARLRAVLDFKGIPMSRVRIQRSTMVRANETADIIAGHLSGATLAAGDNMLREGVPSPFSPSHPTYKPSDYALYAHAHRIESGFRRHFRRPRSAEDEPTYDVIVCHGNVIRYFILRALQLDPTAWLRFTVNHCSITTFRISNSGSVACLGVGDSGHFPPNKTTSH